MKLGWMSVLLINIILIKSVMAQDSYKIQNYYQTYKKTTTPVVSLSANNQLGDGLKFSALFYMTPTFAQSLAGFDYRIFKFLSIGLKAGIQVNNGQLFRCAGYWALCIKKIYCTGYYEYGGTNDRANALLFYRYKENNFGLMWQKKNDFHIVGPRIDLKIPKIPLSIWGAAFIALPDKKFACMYGLYANLFYEKISKNN